MVIDMLSELYFDAASEIAVNEPYQNVFSSRFKLKDIHVMRTGTKEQPVLQKWGDNLRIDWGHLYLAVPQGNACAVIFKRFQICWRGTGRNNRHAGL